MATSGPNELAESIDNPVSYSNRILSQAEGVRTDFYTINFARLACNDIHIAPQGQRLYNHCLTNLPVYRSGDERLQFGWGDRHLLRNIGVQLFEYEHLLLASALGEFFSDDYSAAVFSSLADGLEQDDRPKPHLSSFRGFVHGANGILSTSEFPVIVDDRIRMNPYRDHDQGMPHARHCKEMIPIPKLAGALCQLGELRSHAKELTFIGGDVLGWFSAFTDLCLGIDVTLFDKDGKELHRANAGQTARLKLVFAPIDTPQQDQSAVWLREAIDPTIASTSLPSILAGRITGQALFTKVFGNAFQRLFHAEGKSFANALGGLARTWDIFAHDEATSTSVISAENRANTASLGIGLVQTWMNWFPELRHLQGRMERALHQDPEGAALLCRESISHLEPVCGCHICCETQGTEEKPTNSPSDAFCLPTLMETVVMLGLALSRVTLTPNLFPSRAGVLAMYQSQVRKRLDVKKTKAVGLDRYHIIFGEDWNSTHPKRLANAIALFSGSWPKRDLPENLMAISHQGMCAYSLKLQRGDFVAPSLDDHVIRVVSGTVQWKQKILRRVCLGPVQPPVGIEDGWESISCVHLKEKLFVK